MSPCGTPSPAVFGAKVQAPTGSAIARSGRCPKLQLYPVLGFAGSTNATEECSGIEYERLAAGRFSIGT
jgi:hypothetical protein